MTHIPTIAEAAALLAARKISRSSWHANAWTAR